MKQEDWMTKKDTFVRKIGRWLFRQPFLFGPLLRHLLILFWFLFFLKERTIELYENRGHCRGLTESRCSGSRHGSPPRC